MLNFRVGYNRITLYGSLTAHSGGHINPAVSLMFLTFRQINALRFILYTLGELSENELSRHLTS